MKTLFSNVGCLFFVSLGLFFSCNNMKGMLLKRGANLGGGRNIKDKPPIPRSGSVAQPKTIKNGGRSINTNQLRRMSTSNDSRQEIDASYKILNVTPDTKFKDIPNAHKKLFKEINEEYSKGKKNLEETLKDKGTALEAFNTIKNTYVPPQKDWEKDIFSSTFNNIKKFIEKKMYEPSGYEFESFFQKYPKEKVSIQSDMYVALASILVNPDNFITHLSRCQELYFPKDSMVNVHFEDDYYKPGPGLVSEIINNVIMKINEIKNMDQTDIFLTEIPYGIIGQLRSLLQGKINDQLRNIDSIYKNENRNFFSRMKVLMFGRNQNTIEKLKEIKKELHDLVTVFQETEILYSTGLTLCSEGGLETFLFSLISKVNADVIKKIKHVRNSDNKKEQEQFIKELAKILSNLPGEK